MRTWIRRAFGLLILIGIMLPARAWAHGSPPLPTLPQDIGFDQNLGAQLPLDLAFQEANGQSVKLGDLFHDRPVILQFAYYNCTMLCGEVFIGLSKSINAFDRYQLGKDFSVITVSIDPRETPADAKVQKDVQVRETPGAADNWYFLTGAEDAITQLTAAAGLRYAYDAVNDEYAHPAGVLIVTPEGKVSRYLFGIDFPALDLRLGLAEAGKAQIGSPVEQLLLLCYHYDPVNGKYSPAIFNVLRVSGVSAVLGLALGIYWLMRRSGRPS